ncbi:HD domain-containing protein [Streptomyces sp. CB02261]|uniref:HD domain-containing protein n=1 Tax=Streptomyces sp. CB02261 TaxID=1703940 RepID=UPI0009A0C4EF|nr:HD domain-containing protein [Streptomyces sp. CB02261]
MSAEATNPVSAAEAAVTDATVRRRVRARIDLRRLGRAALLGATAGPAPRDRLPDAISHVAEAHRAHHPEADLTVLRRAYILAESSHRGQFRKSGEPYITHPLAVTLILAELGAETTTLTASLLHDTVEDTEVTLDQVRREFGEEVAYLVDGVTKVEKIDYGAAAEPETFRKMLVATGNDVRVMSIKLADRLHNMRTLGVMRPEKQARIAKVTRDVLIPLAERLGVQALKTELEDLVFAILHPEEYETTRALIADNPHAGDALRAVAEQVSAVLREADIAAEVVVRPRHFVSVHRVRLKRGELRGCDFGRLLVLVAEDADCYAVLGELHTCFTPVISEFKDFIAAPKFNLYQSLHTAIAAPDGAVAEVLIRTHRMHTVAEAGVVALGNPHVGQEPAGQPGGGPSATPGRPDPTAPASLGPGGTAHGPGVAPASGASYGPGPADRPGPTRRPGTSDRSGTSDHPEAPRRPSLTRPRGTVDRPVSADGPDTTPDTPGSPHGPAASEGPAVSDGPGISAVPRTSVGSAASDQPGTADGPGTPAVPGGAHGHAAGDWLGTSDRPGATDGHAASYGSAASDGPASHGPASDGPASHGPASDGPASEAPASVGPAPDRPVTPVMHDAPGALHRPGTPRLPVAPGRPGTPRRHPTAQRHNAPEPPAGTPASGSDTPAPPDPALPTRSGAPAPPDPADDGERVDPTRPGWLSRLLDWQESAPDPDTFWTSLRADLAEDDEITVFRADGSAPGTISLPAGASCVDAAYAQHGEAAHACLGARVNGRLAPLSTVLGDGDTVQLLLAQDAVSGPSPEWLDHARTPAARIAITRWLEAHPESAAPPATITDPRPPANITADRRPGAELHADLEGEPPAAVRPAGCCTPVPPDEITGFRVRGGSVTVHRVGCAAADTMRRLGRDPVAVRWGDTAQGRVTLVAESFGRPGLLADLTEAIAATGAAVVSANVEPPSEQRVRHTYTLHLPDVGRLAALMRAMRDVPGVYDVSRARHRPSPHRRRA